MSYYHFKFLDNIKLKIYSIICWILLPFALVRIIGKGLREPGYYKNLEERFGFYTNKTKKNIFWVHAVSVGETKASEPLIKELLINFPKCKILITHFTAAGRDIGINLFKGNSDIIQSFLPYDTIWMTKRFLLFYKPKICILVETEIWPNLITSCKKLDIPVILINARISKKSFKKTVIVSRIFPPIFNKIKLASAQTKQDAKRLKLLGISDVHVTGNLKFDNNPPEILMEKGLNLKKRIGSRSILLCASTRLGEESLIIDAFKNRKFCENLFLIIVPRHPNRFGDVSKLILKSGLKFVRKSYLGSSKVTFDTQVLLGDTIGEMFLYFSACDISFIGGSLLPMGGQNLIEAASCGKPILIGKYTYNFLKISEDAINHRAAMRVDNGDDIFIKSQEILNNKNLFKNMSANSKIFSKSYKGATAKTIKLIKNLINE